MPEHSGSKRFAHHIEWNFVPEAFVWSEANQPLRPNFYRYGTELHKWMLRDDAIVPVLFADDVAFTNPYTKHASVLIAQFQRISNESAIFTEEPDHGSNFIRAELRRIRLFSEFILYSTRICEVLVKQLLYGTSFLPKLYRRAALGALLSQDCRACRKGGKEPHQLSLLGSLAHPYGFCKAYEHCLENDLSQLNAMRSANTAHASTWEVRNISVGESRLLSQEQTLTAGNTLVHMLRHITDIEGGFWRNLTDFLRQRGSAS